MKTVELNAQAREEFSRKAIKEMRFSGRIPGVIYDNSKSTAIHVNLKELQKILFSPETYIIKLNLNGEVIDTIIREVQYHKVKDNIEHIDFLAVNDTKEVVLAIPITLINTPVGVTKGGKLVSKLRRVKVKGIPTKLPATLEVDIAPLDLGTTIKVRDIKSENIKVITSPSTAIATVEIPRSLRSVKEAAKK